MDYSLRLLVLCNAIAFEDSIAEDKQAEINKQTQLVAAGLQSKRRAIMKVHGVTEDEARIILLEITQEERQQSPDLKELEAEGATFGQRECSHVFVRCWIHIWIIHYVAFFTLGFKTQ